MSGPVTIESYSASYQAGIFDLILPIQQQEYGIQITAAQQPDLGGIENFYQRGNGNFWIALDAGRVVGTISLKDIGDRCVALRKMFVHKDYRGAAHRVAKHLLDTVAAWSEDRHIEAIYLGTTPQFLAAHRFYEKNGFVEITADQLPPSFPLMAVDKKFYRYACKP